MPQVAKFADTPGLIERNHPALTAHAELSAANLGDVRRRHPLIEPAETRHHLSLRHPGIRGIRVALVHPMAVLLGLLSPTTIERFTSRSSGSVPASAVKWKSRPTERAGHLPAWFTLSISHPVISVLPSDRASQLFIVTQPHPARWLVIRR